MPRGLSATILNGWLDTLEGTAFTAPAAFWVQLHTGDPGAAGTANVSSVTTRQQVTAANFNAASGGSKAMAVNAIQWINWAGANESVSDITFWTAATGGTFIGSAQAASAKNVVAGDTLRLTTLTISIAPVAS